MGRRKSRQVIWDEGSIIVKKKKRIARDNNVQIIETTSCLDSESGQKL
jgi:hypothetical protein